MEKGLKLFVLFFLTSCSALRKESQLLTSSMATTSMLTLSQKQSANKVLVLNDSSTSVLSVELIPVGTFSYSIKDGFVGEASQLTFNKKETQRQHTTMKEEVEQEVVKRVQQSNLAKELIQVKAKERLAINWFPLMFTMVILFLIYLIWLKWKKRFKEA